MPFARSIPRVASFARVLSEQTRRKLYLPVLPVIGAIKQADDTHLYDVDIKNRLQDAGFEVDVVHVSDLPTESVQSHILDYPSTKEVFFCTKP